MLDAELIKKAIEDIGVPCDILRVISRQDFIAAMEHGGFDIILSDYSLPNFDGLSALDIAKKRCPDIPFIFVSGAMGEELAVETLRNGATDYVLKDNMSKIVSSIQRALTESAERSNRKKAEAALKRSEQKYRKLYESLQDGCASIDMSGRIIECNQAFKEMLGYTQEELYKFTYRDITPEQWHAAEDRILREQVMERGFSDTYEKEYVKKDGTVFPVELTAYLLLDAEDTPIGMWAFIRDITERKLDEKALLNYSAEINDLYNNAPCGYHSLDGDGVFVRINDTELSMLGYSRDEIIDRKKFSDIITPDSLAVFQSTFPVFKKQGLVRDIEFEIVRKDGSILPVLLSATAIRDPEGNFVMSRSTILDITRRKELEKIGLATTELLKLFSQTGSRQEYFDLIVQKIHKWSDYECVGVRVAKDNGTIPYESHIGFSREFLESENLLSVHVDQCACIRTVLGSLGIQDLPHTTPSGSFHCNDMMDFIARLSQQGRKSFRGACAKYGYASVTIVPIRRDDVILGAIHLADKKANMMPRQILELLESVSNIIGEAIYRFDLQDEKARLKSEAIKSAHLASIGELAAGVAHEINNPISGVINCAEMLLDRFSSGSKEQELADRIIKEGVRVANIVKSLLAFAKQGGQDKRPVRIEDILLEALALTDTMLKKDGVSVVMSNFTELPQVMANFQQIQQVFLNLINNSRYALKQKFGDSDNKQIRITTALIALGNKPYVRTIFLDNGTGIAGNIINRVMEPFVSTKPGNEGTGLGLSISHGIISDHNGIMAIESDEGEFTKVIIDLPALPAGERKNGE